MSPKDPSASVTSGLEYRFGDFTYSVARELLRNGVPETGLPPRALAVLEVLLARPGVVVSKDELLELAWPGSFVSEDSLTHAISLLRQVFDDDARAPRFIQTVHRRGYRFVASVSMANDGSAVKAELLPPPQPPAPTRLRLFAGAAVLAAVLGALYLTQRAPAAGGAMPTIERILLAEFTTDGSADAAEFVAAARPAIRDTLERETKLTVTPLAATGAVHQPGDVVMDAEVRMQADRMVVVARVRDADERTLWRQEWDIPAEKAGGPEFARSLRSRLSWLLQLSSVFSTMRRPGSKDAGLLAVHASELFLGPAQQDLLVALQAADSLGRAMQLDPEFARARAGRIAALAEASGWREWSEEELLEARQEVAAARASDPNDPVVAIAAALVGLLGGDVALARSELERAEQLAPDFFWIYLIRAETEHLLGFEDLALATARHAVALDPYLPAALSRVVDVLLWRGQVDEAETVNRELERLDDSGFWSGRGYVKIARARGEHGEVERRLGELQERWANAAWIHRMAADYYEERGDQDRAAAARRNLQGLVR